MSIVANLSRWWLPVHLVCLVAVLLQPTTPPVMLGRYSQTSLTVMGVLLLTIPVVWVLQRQLLSNPKLLAYRFSPVQSVVCLAICSIASGMIWGVNIGPTLSYIVIRLYISLILLVIAVFVLHQTGTAISVKDKWIGLIFVGSCIVLFFLSRSVPGLFWTDEGFNTSVALSYGRLGYITVPSSAYIASGPIYSLAYLLLGGWFSIFGISVVTIRLFVMFIGLATLGVCYLTLRQYYTKLANWLALTLAFPLLLAMNYLRADIEVSLFLGLAICFYGIALQGQNRNWVHFWVGYFSALTLDGHPNAYRFVIAFVVAYMIEYVLLIRNNRRLLIYKPIFYLIVGQALGVLCYLLFYNYLAPKSFLQTLYGANAMLSFSLSNSINLMLEQVLVNFSLAPMLVFAVVLCLFIAPKYNNPLIRLVIIISIVSLGVFSLTYGYFRTYYVLHNVTLWIILAASLFEFVYTWLQTQFGTNARLLMTGIYIFALTTVAGHVVQIVRAVPSQDYQAALTVADKIREIVPKSEAYVGIDPFYIRMHDYPQFIEMNTASILANRSKITELAAWEQLAPTAITIVPNYPIPPSDALLKYLELRPFEQVRCWIVPTVGKVELYMLKVPSGIDKLSHCVPL